MPNATLSRWTLSYFAAALVYLFLGQAALASGWGLSAFDFQAPETLATVHLLSIGWLGLLMTGALLQFVPVLVAKPLRREGLALPALIAINGGLACLVGGFMSMAGTNLPISLLPIGAIALLTGFSLAGISLATTLWSARPLPLPARLVALGLVALAFTVLLGLCFALGLSGLVVHPIMVTLIDDGISLHAALGLGGWLSLTAIGVSYRLLPMFLLAPETERTTNRVVVVLSALALILILATLGGLVAGWQKAGFAAALALVLALVLVALYLSDVLHFFWTRRRKSLELNSMASFAALTAFVLAAGLLALAAAAGNDERAIGSAIYLLAFGWLSGLGLAQLYKIVPFLTWIECYGPILGKRPVPRVQNLVNERTAKISFLGFYLGIALATIAFLGKSQSLLQAGAALQIMASVAIVRELLRARRLRYPDPALALPEGARRPNLFLPNFNPRS